MQATANVMEMAGYCAAHAIWRICDGETLMPLVGYLYADNSRSMERLAMPVAELVQGNGRLIDLAPNQQGAVLIKDGRLQSRHRSAAGNDCLILDIRFAGAAQCRLQYAVPYRSSHHELGFAVHSPVLSDCLGFDAEQVEVLGEFFFKGLASHEQGGATWHGHFQPQFSQHGDHAGQFTLEELRLLRRVPLLVYVLMLGAEDALADGHVQHLAGLLAAAGRYLNPLLTRLVSPLPHDLGTQLAALVVESVDAAAQLRVIHQLFDAQLPEPESRAFAKALLALAEDIAAAPEVVRQAGLGRVRRCLGLNELCV